MPDRSVLLVSSDPSLVDFVREELPSPDRFQLHVAHSPDEAVRRAGRHEWELIVIHIDEWIGDDGIARLIWEAAARPRRIPILAVGERYELEKASTMLRLGVADYLSRQDHLRQLVPLIHALSEGGKKESERGVEAPIRPVSRLERSAISTS